MLETLLDFSLYIKNRTSKYFNFVKESEETEIQPSVNEIITRCNHKKYEPGQNKDKVQKTIELCSKKNISIIPYYDPRYPELLKNIYDPPLILYVMGTLKLNAVSIGIVGARKCSLYGKKVAFAFGERLAQAGCSIISGLAYGIDANAHLGALKCDGHTIAVLGCGVDIPYPKRNADIYDRIIEKSGGIVSELPPGSRISKHNFPLRNRIISGLSRGVVIVEAAERSGALITTRCALEEGREVFSVPGPITSSVSVGTNRLIKISGAKLVTSIQDVLEEFSLTDDKYFDKLHNALPETECRILSNIPYTADTALDVDCLSRMLDIPVRELLLKVFEYENDGLISRTNGNKLYRIK
ncbi:DNA-processing protein DprA [bacterium]|nr:DNA-processing protein DprA [bacterium]